MVKIIGTKEEVNTIVNAIKNNDVGLVTYEYIDNQPKNTFQIQCTSEDGKDLDYRVELEYTKQAEYKNKQKQYIENCPVNKECQGCYREFVCKSE